MNNIMINIHHNLFFSFVLSILHAGIICQIEIYLGKWNKDNYAITILLIHCIT